MGGADGRCLSAGRRGLFLSQFRPDDETCLWHDLSERHDIRGVRQPHDCGQAAARHQGFYEKVRPLKTGAAEEETE